MEYKFTKKVAIRWTDIAIVTSQGGKQELALDHVLWKGYASTALFEEERVNATKQPKKELRYMDVNPEDKNKPFITFRQKSLVGVMRNTGLVILEPTYHSIGEAQDSVFYSNRAPVRLRKKWGYIDTLGNLVIDTIYTYAGSFSNGLGRVQRDGKMGFINVNGEIVVPTRYQEAQDFTDGLASVYNGDKWGFINTDGKVAIDFRFDVVESFYNGRATFGQWGGEKMYHGMIDKTGTIIFPAKYESTFFFDPRFADLSYVMAGGKYGFINKAGQIVIKPIYDEVMPTYENGIFWVKSAGKFFLINTKGVQVGGAFEECDHFSEGLAAVGLNGKYGFVDNTGKLVITPRFSGIRESFKNGYALVNLGEKSIKINRKGEEVND